MKSLAKHLDPVSSLLALSMALAACGGGKIMGMPGTGAGGPGSPTGTGGAHVGPGGPGTTGTGTGGSVGVATCTPGVERAIVTDCGYPDSSNNPLSSTIFNENEVLEAIQPSGTWPNGVVRLFYSDEHAMTLGVRSVTVNSSSGASTSDYTVSPLMANPDTALNPATGTTLIAGDQSGLDPAGRPMWPVLYITDVTGNPSSRAGDWQQGGTPIGPNKVFGTWKAALRTVDKTTNPWTVTITPDADPAKNGWTLGSGADSVPSGLANQGYGAEVSWNVTLQPGRSYRLQVLVHDGDQNKAGGDVGEACVLFCTGGNMGTCPAGYTAFLTSEGQVCLPISGGSGGSSGSGSGGSSGSMGGSGGGDCPSGSVNYLTSEGASCVPIAQPPGNGAGGCSSGLVSYKTATGSTACVGVPTSGGGCADGTSLYFIQSEGAICVPTASDGSCPEGYTVSQSASGPICI